MWWLFVSALDFLGRGPGFESASPTVILIPDALQYYCVIM